MRVSGDCEDEVEATSRQQSRQAAGASVPVVRDVQRSQRGSHLTARCNLEGRPSRRIVKEPGTCSIFFNKPLSLQSTCHCNQLVTAHFVGDTTRS